MHEADMRRLGISDGEIVDLIGEAGDSIERMVPGLRATRYDVPRGSCAGYYPECNPLLPLWHHAKRSHVPAAKSIPVRIRKT
jgi:anaerobic selenocysteine-containing dehydrogenase